MQAILLVFLAGFQSVAHADECDEWFKESKLNASDKNCLSKCLVLGTGMDTFMCHQGCARYCKTPLTKALTMDLAYFPGLTKAERALIAEYPKEALKVFQQMNLAETLTIKNFNRSTQLDESDAFRHFVWAALLAKEIGTDVAEN